MKKQLAIWQLISRCLHEEVPVMLLYVVESKGSSPGRQGFFMAVTGNGETQGSIGGGIMENKFIEMAKKNLKQEAQELVLRKQIHDKKAAKNQSGMICSGEQTICIYRVQQSDINYIERILDGLRMGRNGSLNLSPAGLQFSETCPELDFSFSNLSDNNWLYEEKTGYKNHLYIIGAGHCALAFSQIMQSMDFFIHLYDDRPNLPTFLLNEFVNQKQVLNNYHELEGCVPEGENNYVVAMTVGYRTDDIVVRTLLGRRFKYFGLLGSAKKIDKMLSDYRKEGLEQEFLDRIYAPIGLPINSQTPEEIAISIAAQIIEVKNRSHVKEKGLRVYSNS